MNPTAVFGVVVVVAIVVVVVVLVFDFVSVDDVFGSKDVDETEEDEGEDEESDGEESDGEESDGEESDGDDVNGWLTGLLAPIYLHKPKKALRTCSRKPKRSTYTNQCAVIYLF